MSHLDAVALARGFSQCGNITASTEVEDLLEQGYTPDEALMLAGIGGYGSDN